MQRPETRYARSGDVHIAYQVFGEGPLDLVWVPGAFSHVELGWEDPDLAATFERMASIARLVIFDKRGTGLSDRIAAPPAYEEHLDDVCAVMDAVRLESAALFGQYDGGILALLFAATHPERTRSLLTFGTTPRALRSDDYPWGFDPEFWNAWVRQVEEDFSLDMAMSLLYVDRWSDPDFRSHVLRVARASIGPGAFAAFLRNVADTDIRHVLPLVRAPTLVMHLEDDRFLSPENARYIAQHVPNARLLLVSGNTERLLWTDDVIDEVEEFLTGTRPIPRADRVLATVLFMDLVSSTQRAAELGDRRWRELLDRFERIVRKELERHRGKLVSTTGDGFLATFDGPARAIRCGEVLRDSLLAIELETRAGLHSGEVELRGEDVAGLGVHIASRVMDTAEPGEVRVSSTVKDLVVGSGIEFEDRGMHSLKGVPDDWQLFAVRST